ncbi:protein-(glutamine-N5) methyltransferase, release factor-specific [Sphingobium chlorophenolicum L-1]|uniref:Release factor glutamine methyltransferase n=2 Tax=Sphingobium chlorophenolicum TaxID=46429 RepID=F6EXC6_SPHCR|nr:protein-(glutamine-N5) methyltransferase, release factor-specific [Sphingobium chlorophenolicum L-1]
MGSERSEPAEPGNMTTIPETLRAATERLAPVSATPRLDAELLLAHALRIDRNDLLLRQRDLSIPPDFDALLQRRLTGEPIAYITGTRDFWTISLHVTPDVLIPRPDSETLIEAALDHFGARSPARILDLGTGSGALLLAALSQWPQARGTGVDISPAALAVAQDNADRLGFGERAAFRLGNWAEGIEGPFDLILINPPYIARDVALAGDVLHEPESALFAGADGLDDYRRIAPTLPRLLAPDGMAAIEIGYDQRLSVSALLADQGLSVASRRDLAGHERCLMATPARPS